MSDGADGADGADAADGGADAGDAGDIGSGEDFDGSSAGAKADAGKPSAEFGKDEDAGRCSGPTPAEDCVVSISDELMHSEDHSDSARRNITFATFHSSSIFMWNYDDKDKRDRWEPECVRGNPTSCASLRVLEREIPEHQEQYNKTFFTVDVTRAKLVVGKMNNATIKALHKEGKCIATANGLTKDRAGASYAALHYRDASLVQGINCAAGDKGACGEITMYQNKYNVNFNNHVNSKSVKICVLDLKDFDADLKDKCLDSKTKNSKLETFGSLKHQWDYLMKRKDVGIWDGACIRGNAQACATLVVGRDDLKRINTAWAQNEYGPEAPFACYLDKLK